MKKFPNEIFNKIIEIYASIKIQKIYRGYRIRKILDKISPEYTKNFYKYYGNHCNATKRLNQLRLKLIEIGYKIVK